VSSIVRELVRTSFTEWRTTVVGPSGVSVGESAEAAYRELAAAMRAAGVEPLQEKTYCAAGTRAEVEAARGRALASVGLDPSTPWAFLRGRQDVGGDDDARAVSVQLWGITRRAAGVRVSTIEAERHRGRLLEAPGLRLAWLGPIDASAADGTLPRGITAQTEAMLGNAERALEALGLSFRDVARTWIYARELLAGYRELNAARTAFYGARGIGRGPDARPFPASTGIQGRVDAEECVMDLLAVRADAGAARLTPVDRSDRQGPAFAYGSSFSRAMALDLEGRQTLFVSGTSSIGPDGATLYPHDPERQSVETLLGLASLLEPLGASLRDVASGTLFTRDAAALAAFERVARGLCLPELPLARVRADVCRPDLTVELEAVVHVPGSAARGGLRS
jgi:enamine deaminase RidA (YjgF/YER057c/UK114 family)